MHKMMLRSLSPLRVFNFLLIYLSYHISRLIGTSVHAGSPIAISVEPTTSCNLRCPECPSGLRSFTRETGMLKQDLFNKIIDEVSGRTMYLTLYFQGEPFLNTGVYDMIRYAKLKRMIVVTSTNGHYLNEENCKRIIDSGLDRLIISIDGATQESYAKYRIGGDLEKVIDGVKLLSSMKKKMSSAHPFISIQTVIFSSNEHELDSLKQLAVEVDADEINFKTAQVYEFEAGNGLIPQNEKLSRYKKQHDGSYVLRSSIENKCWRMWSSGVITWDGKVVPCCFDKDAHYKMGDLKTATLRSVWKAPQYRQFRNKILSDRRSIDICRNCSEGSEIFIG